MKFRFKVSNVAHLKAANVYSLDGVVESGNVTERVTARVENSPGRRATIVNVALVNAKDPLSEIVTVSIEKPSFPLEDLRGATLVAD